MWRQSPCSPSPCSNLSRQISAQKCSNKKAGWSQQIPGASRLFPRSRASHRLKTPHILPKLTLKPQQERTFQQKEVDIALAFNLLCRTRCFHWKRTPKTATSLSQRQLKAPAPSTRSSNSTVLGQKEGKNNPKLLSCCAHPE